MNNATIRINSYTQKASFWWNGEEISFNSNLQNFSYADILNTPGKVINAIIEEMNDEFELSVMGNMYEYLLFANAEKDEGYCVSCKRLAPPVDISSTERANMLGTHISTQTFTVAVPDDGTTLPANLPYGNISVSFVDVDDADLRITLGQNKSAGCICLPVSVDSPRESVYQVMVSAIETHLTNPLIGAATAALSPKSGRLAICDRLTPLIRVSCPEKLEIGSSCALCYSVEPAGSTIPPIKIRVSAGGIVSAVENTLFAQGIGDTELKFYVDGAQQPFATHTISVYDANRACELLLGGIPTTMHQGKHYPLIADIQPIDASDRDSLMWETSDTGIAVVNNGELVCMAPGEFTLTAKTTNCKACITIKVLPVLQKLSLSKESVKLPVGSKTEIQVLLEPDNAYNASYHWVSSDETVAKVIRDGDTELVCSVGIGQCILTCAADEGTCSAKCDVDIISMMYAHKPINPISVFGIIFLALWLVLPKYNTLCGILGAVLSIVAFAINLRVDKYRKNYFSAIASLAVLGAMLFDLITR